MLRTNRSRAREVALQLLYQREMNPSVPRDAIEQFVEGRLYHESLRPFCLTLLDGVVQYRTDLDAQLNRAADNWRVERMTFVDRNVLRLGAFELLHHPATPSAVAITEAIELARRFGSKNSPSFVNGVLDRLHRSLEKSKESNSVRTESIQASSPETSPSS